MISRETVSVAMCTFNGELYLEQQLSSIAAQSRQPDELIICDDCSCDNTVKIVEEFASQASFSVRLYRNYTNLGSNKNYEKAISLSSCDIIFLSDQDDIWHYSKIEMIVEMFKNNWETGAIFSNAEMVNSELLPLGYDLWQSTNFTRFQQYCLRHGNAFAVLLKHNVATGSTFAFRREFKNLILPIPSNWVHDGWIALLIAAVSNLDIIQSPLIKYRQHEKNQIGAIKKQLNKQFINALNKKSDYYDAGCSQVLEIKKRLIEINNEHISNTVLHNLDVKMKHLTNRANMPRNVVLRLSSILFEIITYRYYRYSNGIKSIAKDIFIH